MKDEVRYGGVEADNDRTRMGVLHISLKIEKGDVLACVAERSCVTMEA